jgi:hypothetical protein
MQLLGTDTLEPLEAIYVQVKPGLTAAANLQASQEVSAPPSRTLSAGLHLVGPAPAYEISAFPTRPVDQVLYSIAQAPGGMIGYSAVISPNHNQGPWTYVPGGQVPQMLPFKGYWVMMTNQATLYGFSVTPIGQ